MAGSKEFGNRIKTLRLSIGLSQEQLAEKIKVEYQTISRIETGCYFTSYENLQKISNALGVSIKDLFDYSENEYAKDELISIINDKLKYLKINDIKNINKIIDCCINIKYNIKN